MPLDTSAVICLLCMLAANKCRKVQPEKPDYVSKPGFPVKLEPWTCESQSLCRAWGCGVQVQQ